MEKSIEGKSVFETLKTISEALEIEIKFEQNPSDIQKVSPSFNVGAMISRFMAILVFVGFHVPANSMPSFNSVHADIEWWKRRMEDKKIPGEKSDGIPES